MAAYLLYGSAQSSWKILDTHLAGGQFVAAGRMTIADLSACGYLFFGDELGVYRNQYPNVRGWLHRIRSVPRRKHPHDRLRGHPIAKRA